MAKTDSVSESPTIGPRLTRIWPEQWTCLGPRLGALELVITIAEHVRKGSETPVTSANQHLRTDSGVFISREWLKRETAPGQKCFRVFP